MGIIICFHMYIFRSLSFTYLLEYLSIPAIVTLFLM